MSKIGSLCSNSYREELIQLFYSIQVYEAFRLPCQPVKLIAQHEEQTVSRKAAQGYVMDKFGSNSIAVSEQIIDFLFYMYP